MVEKERHKEHSFRVPQMRDREHGHPGATVCRVKQSRRIERRSLEPLFETGGRQHGIEPHRQIEPLALREERFQIDDPNSLKRRCLDQITSLPPGGREDVGHDRVFAAAGRSVHAGERQEAGCRAARTFTKQLGVVPDGSGRRGERLEHRHRQSGAAAWRIDRKVGGLAETLDARAVLAPLGESLPPCLGLLRRKGIR